MSLPIRRIENLCLQRLYTVEDGTELELIASPLESKPELGVIPYPVLSIHACDQEKLYMQLFIQGVLVQIPVVEVQRAIEYAKNFVHSESWFEAGNELTCDTDPEPYADWGCLTD